MPGRKAGLLEQRAGDLVPPTSRAASGTAMAMRHRALDALVEIARTRGLLGDERVRDQLADLYLLERAADELPRSLPVVFGGRPLSEHRGSVAKLLGSRLTALGRDLGMALLGLDGLLCTGDRSLDGTIPEFCLFAPAVSIYGGTDQIQKNVLAERALGMRQP